MITTSKQLDQFTATRQLSEAICKPLSIEDYVVQPVSWVSPPKWHLGHTTWFFEEFVLKKHLPEYRIFDSDFAYVFNSYYESMGERVVRANRGNMSRPVVKQVYAYRDYVDRHMQLLFELDLHPDVNKLIEIGIHHEKQHQELLLTDIKYILGNNPLQPPYSKSFNQSPLTSSEKKWIKIAAGNYEIGHTGAGFCYDNELGRHRVYLEDFKIASELECNANFLEFIKDEGYKRFEFWHAEAWDWVQQNHIEAPLYWFKIKNNWCIYSLGGVKELDPNGLLTHLSYYEAFAYAQWKGVRLPTEFEWEAAQSHFKWGARWEWTESAYLPYPHYKKAAGALGEYNGKFMVNQKVLRGSSIATSPDHARSSYRNFFHPLLRWQFTGLRLAK